MLLTPAPDLRARTSRATVPRCMRKRAEADVGVRGDEAVGATVARVEQDQRDRNLLSSHSASQSTSVSVDSSTSFDGAQVTVGVDSVGVCGSEA
jgi:hypothetical protein